MTSEEIIQFVAKGEIVCPYCEYDDLEGDSPETQDNEIRQEMFCPNCQMDFIFIYSLSWVVLSGEDE